MNPDFDLEKLSKELAALQLEMENARKDAFNSMREVAAYRLFGGEASAWDEEEVVFVAVDSDGAPATIRLTNDWDDEYTPEELSQTIALIAKQLESQRVARAKQHIKDFPEEFEAITDEEVERLFAESQAKASTLGASSFEEMEAEAVELSREVTKLDQETAPLRSGDASQLSDERPVSIITIGKMMVGIRLSPEFANRSTTVQINAALAEEIDRTNSEEVVEDASATDRLRTASAKARAYADILRTQNHTASNAFTRN